MMQDIYVLRFLKLIIVLLGTILSIWHSRVTAGTEAGR